MKKILKQMYVNLFMQHLLPLVIQDSCTTKLERLAMIGIKTHEKDLKKYAIKVKYWIHDYKAF